MNNDFLNELKDTISGDVVFGKKISLSDDISLLPVYKLKLNYLKVDGKTKYITGDCGSVNVVPLCFIEIKPGGIRIHNLTHEFNIGEVMDKAPNIIDTVSKLFDFDMLKK